MFSRTALWATLTIAFIWTTTTEPGLTIFTIWIAAWVHGYREYPHPKITDIDLWAWISHG